MEVPLLKDIIIIFGLSIVVLLLCHRIHIPTIVGFLFTGVLCGPHGLALISNPLNVETLATIGIVLLLFSIGMEFSLKKILQLKRFFLLGGSLQVLLTVLASFTVAKVIGRPTGEALFLGFLISLSSTAIVLKVLEERVESSSPHGKITLAILIFQDIVAIPMMLVLPLLSGIDQNFDENFFWVLAKGVIILIVVGLSAEKIVPKILYHIAKTRNRELFLLSVLVICFSVAWLASSLGLSLSLGAFLAGLIIADSEYSNEAISDIIPFQNLFTSFFFVSIGMLLDIGFFLEHPLTIIMITLAVLALKSMIAGGVALMIGMPLRTAVFVGIALSQIGEFSFVLARTGLIYGLGDYNHYQLFLSVSLFTMALSPSLIYLSQTITDLFIRLPFLSKLASGLKTGTAFVSESLKKDHVIIVGFGVSGRNLAKSSKEVGVPYVVLEMNAETVNAEKRKGEPIHFGDATHALVLKHANIKEAKVIAVVVNDPAAAVRIVKQARLLNPKIYIIARTHYMHEMKPMYDVGANDVIPDEFGTSIEIFTRVMHKYGVPGIQLEKLVTDLRKEGYEMVRLRYKEPSMLSNLGIENSDTIIESLVLNKNSPFVNKTLAEANIRSQYGITVLVIKRGNDTIADLHATTVLQANDTLTIIGKQENVKHFSKSNLES